MICVRSRTERETGSTPPLSSDKTQKKRRDERHTIRKREGERGVSERRGPKNKTGSENREIERGKNFQNRPKKVYGESGRRGGENIPNKTRGIGDKRGFGGMKSFQKLK